MITPRRGVHTAAELRNSTRRLDRSCATAASALAAMLEGQFLHLQYEAGRALWSLSGGQSVPANVAAILISNASVVPVGDALFADIPGQTWRFVSRFQNTALQTHRRIEP